MKKTIVTLLSVTLILSAFFVPETVNAASIAKPVVTVKNIDDNYLKVSWKKCRGASKYAVYRSTSRNGSYKKMAITKRLSYYDDTAKNKKTYYYKVKALGQNSSSKMSKIKSGRITFDGKIRVELDFPELPLHLGEVRTGTVYVSGCDDDVYYYYDSKYIDVVTDAGIDGEYPIEIWVNDCKPFSFETKIVFKFADHENIYKKVVYVPINALQQ